MVKSKKNSFSVKKKLQFLGMDQRYVFCQPQIVTEKKLLYRTACVEMSLSKDNAV